jgi:mevalonate kinase
VTAPRGRAHGKAILIGEHAVVHGSAAIAMPVGLQVEVELGLAEPAPLHPGFLQWFGELALARTGQAWLPAKIRGDLPMGVGLGSSAALSVAALRGLGTIAPWAADALLAAADSAERIFHGNPSGLDVRAVLADGPLAWRRLDGGGLHLEPATVGADLAFELWVTLPGPSTADMVELVSHALAADDQFAAITRATGHVEAARAALAVGDPQRLGAEMQAFQHWLRRYGASTPILDELVLHALQLGAAGAKVTGAGGGGAMLVLWPDGPRAAVPLPPAVRRFAFTLAATSHGSA